MKRKPRAILLLFTCLLSLCLFCACADPPPPPLSDEFDETTVKDTAQQVVQMINRGDYQKVRDKSAPPLAKGLTDKAFAEENKTILKPAGAYLQTTDIAISGFEDPKTKDPRAAAVVTAEHEVRKVYYRIEFNEEMQIVGILVRDK